MTTGSTYKVVELVGTSSEGIDQAIEGAIARAGQTLNGLDWFEVKEIRGQIQVGMWTGDRTQKSSLTLSYGHLSSFSSRLTSSSNRFPQLQP